MFNISFLAQGEKRADRNGFLNKKQNLILNKNRTERENNHILPFYQSLTPHEPPTITGLSQKSRLKFGLRGF